jgi:ABC-type uncharacterized transport system auxiliary subunit
MHLKPKFTFSVLMILLVAFVFFLNGCSRSAARIPGASLPFPETKTAYIAKTNYPYTIVVKTPVDLREKHYGENVAGTKWTGCSTDPFWGTDAPTVIHKRLTKEIQDSHLFSKVVTEPNGPNDIIMKTEIHAFCSQSYGFVVIRVAGITSLRIILEQNGKMLLDRKFEKVITDADKEYTGSQVSFIEQAMSVTMADSLRELQKDMLKQFEADIGTRRNRERM